MKIYTGDARGKVRVYSQDASESGNIAEDNATTDPNYKGVSGVKKGTNRLITSTL